MNMYKITGYFAGTAYATYHNGWLLMCICNDLRQGSGEVPLGAYNVPLQEFDLMHSEMLTAKELKPKSVADKVAKFCLVYKQHKGFAYRAMKEEKANLKNVSVTDQLLNTYFNTIDFPLSPTKTMSDYVRHYNHVRDLATNGKTKKSSFPDVYDLQYEQMISADVSKLQRYWAHLRARGWKKVDGVWTQQPKQ